MINTVSTPVCYPQPSRPKGQSTVSWRPSTEQGAGDMGNMSQVHFPVLYSANERQTAFQEAGCIEYGGSGPMIAHGQLNQETMVPMRQPFTRAVPMQCRPKYMQYCSPRGVRAPYPMYGPQMDMSDQPRVIYRARTQRPYVPRAPKLHQVRNRWPYVPSQGQVPSQCPTRSDQMHARTQGDPIQHHVPTAPQKRPGKQQESPQESSSTDDLMNALTGGVMFSGTFKPTWYQRYEEEFRDKECNQDYFRDIFSKAHIDMSSYLDINPPHTLSEAVKAYIDYLLFENQQRVMPFEQIAMSEGPIPSWSELSHENYFNEMMTRPTEIPTKKFNGWLRLFGMTTFNDEDSNELDIIPVTVTSTPKKHPSMLVHRPNYNIHVGKDRNNNRADDVIESSCRAARLDSYLREPSPIPVDDHQEMNQQAASRKRRESVAKKSSKRTTAKRQMSRQKRGDNEASDTTLPKIKIIKQAESAETTAAFVETLARLAKVQQQPFPIGSQEEGITSAYNGASGNAPVNHMNGTTQQLYTAIPRPSNLAYSQPRQQVLPMSSPAYGAMPPTMSYNDENNNTAAVHYTNGAVAMGMNAQYCQSNGNSVGVEPQMYHCQMPPIVPNQLQPLNMYSPIDFYSAGVAPTINPPMAYAPALESSNPVAIGNGLAQGFIPMQNACSTDQGLMPGQNGSGVNQTYIPMQNAEITSSSDMAQSKANYQLISAQDTDYYLRPPADKQHINVNKEALAYDAMPKQMRAQDSLAVYTPILKDTPSITTNNTSSVVNTDSNNWAEALCKYDEGASKSGESQMSDAATIKLPPISSLTRSCCTVLDNDEADRSSNVDAEASEEESERSVSSSEAETALSNPPASGSEYEAETAPAAKAYTEERKTGEIDAENDDVGFDRESVDIEFCEKDPECNAAENQLQENATTYETAGTALESKVAEVEPQSLTRDNEAVIDVDRLENETPESHPNQIVNDCCEVVESSDKRVNAGTDDDKQGPPEDASTQDIEKSKSISQQNLSLNPNDVTLSNYESLPDLSNKSFDNFQQNIAAPTIRDGDKGFQNENDSHKTWEKACTSTEMSSFQVQEREKSNVTSGRKENVCVTFTNHYSRSPTHYTHESASDSIDISTDTHPDSSIDRGDDEVRTRVSRVKRQLSREFSPPSKIQHM